MAGDPPHICMLRATLVLNSSNVAISDYRDFYIIREIHILWNEQKELTSIFFGMYKEIATIGDSKVQKHEISPEISYGLS